MSERKGYKKHGMKNIGKYEERDNYEIGVCRSIVQM